MKNKECIFILGMHRSGTSAIASVFHDLGFNLGDNLLASDSFNPLGYYEDQKVVDINDNILREFGFEWDNPDAFIELSEDLIVDKLVILENFLQQNFLQTSSIVLKDPRFCLTIPTWIHVCKKLEITTKFILVLRNPLAVSKSLYTRNLFTREKSYQLFINYLLQAEKETRYFDRVIIDFQQFLDDPKQQITQTLKQLSISSLDGKEIRLGEPDKLIKRELVHYSPSVDDIEYDFVKDVYQSLLDNESGGIFDYLKRSYKNHRNFFTKKENGNINVEAQLFYDIGHGFEESKSITKTILISTRQIIFDLDLQDGQSLRRLRFDPSKTPIAIKVYKVYVFDKHGNRELLDVLEYNGMYLSTGQYVFLSFDPIIILSEPSFTPSKVQIDVEISQINQHEVNEISRLFNDFEVIKKDVLKSIKKDVKQKGDAIDKLTSLLDGQLDSTEKENITFHENQLLDKDRDLNIAKKTAKNATILLNEKVKETEVLEKVIRSKNEKNLNLKQSLESKTTEIDVLHLKLKKNKKKAQRYKFQLKELTENLNSLTLLLNQKKSYIGIFNKEELIRQKALDNQLNTIHHLNEMLTVNQALFDENEKKTKQLYLNVNTLKSSLKEKENSFALKVEQYNKIVNTKQQLQKENHELIKSLKMEQQNRQQAEQTITDLEKERVGLQKDVGNNHEGLVNLFNQITTINKNLMQQKGAIDELTQLLQQKDELILHQSHQIHLQNAKIEKISQSFATKFWNFVLFPLRLVYDILTKPKMVFAKIKLFFAFFFITMTKPFKVLRHINGKNINTLFKALKNESPSEILYNFKRLLSNNRPAKISVDQLGIEENNIEPTKTTESAAPVLAVASDTVEAENVSDGMDETGGDAQSTTAKIIELRPQENLTIDDETLHLVSEVVDVVNSNGYSEVKLQEVENERSGSAYNNSPTVEAIMSVPDNEAVVMIDNNNNKISSDDSDITVSIIDERKDITAEQTTTKNHEIALLSTNEIEEISAISNNEESSNEKDEPTTGEASVATDDLLEESVLGEILMCLDYASYESPSLLKIIGWGIGLKGIEKIEILSGEGDKLGSANLGIERLDVHYAYPDYKNSKRAGFLFEEKIDLKIDKIIARVIGKDNKYKELSIDVQPYKPSRVIQQEKKKPYDVWVINNSITTKMRDYLITQQAEFVYRPLISIVIPVYNVEEKWLQKAIDSIRNQIYDNWEICLADDASPKAHVVPFLQKAETSDPRIKVVYRKKNGRISEATNSGLQIATGEYVAFMDNDDELEENAFYEIVAALNKDRTIDVIYSDEDKMTENGLRYDPFFKPDWSPELLLSYNYFNHLLVVRKTIVDDVKGLRSEFDGAQDYDFILRVVEKSKNIHHIPKILYHWRALEGSIAAQGDAKADSFNFFDKVTGVLQDYLDRNNLNGKAFHPPFARERGLGLSYIQWAHTGPMVSIVIPSKNHYETLKTCLDSLEQTSYQNYEIIIADNGSDDKKTLKYLKKLRGSDKIKVITIRNKGDKFSYAYINNEAIKHAKGYYVLLLNDDTEIISPSWLSQMVGYAELDGVGIVGAKLLYPDNTIQHAGVLTDLYTSNYDKMPDHVFKNHSVNDLGYYFFANVTRNYSCVTAACMLISKDLYDDLGGLDEGNFDLAYNDVDLCLKAIKKGKRAVYAADAVLYHYESKSRKDTLDIEEVARFKDKWRDFEDVYYNPNLSKVKPFSISPLSTLNYPIEKEKVLIVSHNLNFEGAPIQMLEIVEGLLKKEDAPIFEIYSPVHGPLREAYEKLGLTVHVFGDPVTKAILKEQAYEEGIGEFRAWLETNEYTTVYANTLVSFFVHEACFDLNVKSIWGIHESAPPEEFFTYLGTELKEKAFESFNYPYSLVFVAKATERIFYNYDLNHSSVVINNGLRTERFKYIEHKKEKQIAIKKELGVAQDDVLFLNLGTVCKRKGQQDFVLAAIDNIKKGITNAKYVIVGARPSDYTTKMLQMIKDNQVEDYFIIVEETGDVEMYYLAADVFVCSSYNESYPRVILEAMLFQLPIISTPIFGIAEQVIEHVNALFYPPGNIYLLNKQMKELSLNHEKRKLFQKNSPYVYQLINSYEEMAEKYEEVIF